MNVTKTKNSYFRSPKTGRSQDDFKVLMVGILFTIFILMFQFTAHSLQEKRWFRDVAHLTPFYDVEVSKVVINDETNSIVISGYMTKRRCIFQDLTGYVIDSNGKRTRILVNTSLEDLSTGIEYGSNRPPSQISESWGPWEIRFTATGSFPVSWEIWAHHKCNSDTEIQSNLFASGIWKNM